MPLPAGPRPRLITGHLADFRADRLGFFTRCARRYGDVVPLRVVHHRALLLSHPDLIEQVLVTQAKNFVKHFGLRMYKPILGNGLVTSEGAFWRRQRKLSAPAFHGGRMAAYAADIVGCAERVADGWRAQARAAGEQTGVVRDVHDDAMRLMLEITCRTLFGADACPEPGAVGRAMDGALRAIDARFGRPVQFPDWVPVPSNRRLRRALRTIDAVVTGVIDRHRGRAGPGADLLSVLLRARDDGGSGMTDGQLKDEVRTLLLAGHETTALALTYALHLLARHPACQAKLQAELSAVVGTGRALSADDLPRLDYARKVIAESLRLYPPADVLGREAIADCSIGGHEVRRGTNVFMSTWVLHRDPRYFAEPETFDPDRWTEPFERSLPRFAYFPFGGGPRSCVGQTLAMTEAVLALATLCNHFHFAADPTFELDLWPSITLRPRAGVRLVVRERA